MNDKPTDSPSPFLEIHGENLVLVAIEFTNGYFVSLSGKDELKLGTVALSLPGIDEGRRMRDMDRTADATQARRNSLTATVLGTRNKIHVEALVERITFATKKMVYLSSNFTENSEELYAEANQLVGQFLKEIL